MTANLQTCLLLSEAVYGGNLENKIPTGWTRIDISENLDTGFYGAAYQNSVTGEIVRRVGKVA